MKYDAIIIGAGQAGPFIGTHLVGQGKKVALAEKAKIGGSCVNYGCIPTKTLIASARAIYMANRGDEYGFTSTVNVDFPAVMARMNRRRGDAHSGFDGWLRGMEDFDVYDVEASFVGSENGFHKVQVGDDILEAEQVFINTGTRPNFPPIDGLDDVDFLTNQGLLDIQELPEHLVILGGSYIGLEFGQAFRRFGSKVTIIEYVDQLIPRESQDVADEVRRILEAEDITVHVGSKATKVSQGGDGSVMVTVEDKQGNVSEVTGSHLLVATGRKPNTDSLNLEAVGVEADERGFIQTNEYLQTNVDGIFAVGDVNGRGAFTHTSYHDHEIVVDYFNGTYRDVSDRNMAYAMYTDPPLGRVGMSEKEARESGKNVLIATKPMSHMGRALEQGETFGMMKLLVDADTKRFLGAAVLGYHGDDVIQVISYFMATGASVKVMQNALPIHPTIAEFLPTVLGELQPIAEYDKAQAG